MTKYERISIFYLLIISTITMIFNFIILNKKVPQLTKTIPAQIEKTVTDTDLNSKTKPASDSSKLAEELAAIHGELSQIRATLREQDQTLGTTDSDIEDLLGDINVSTSSATPTAKLTPRINPGFVKEAN